MSTHTRAPWFYRVLMRCYPADFRREFGDEMEHEFRASLAEAKNAFGRLRVWRRAICDLALSVAREHWDSWGGGRNRLELRGNRLELSGIVLDLRRSARALARAPGFSLVVVLTLALGIGATTLIFSVVHGVLLADLPYPDADRIVSIGEEFEGSPGPVAISYVNAMDWKLAQTTLDALALIRGGALTLSASDGTQQLSAQFVDGEYFEILGAKPLIGRVFGADENRVPGGHPIAVITNDAWHRLFGADPRVVGTDLSLSGSPFTVVGVLSSDYRDPFPGIDGGKNDLIVPAMMVGQIDPRGNAVLEQRRIRSFGAIGKLRRGVTVQQADADLRQITARLQEVEPINRGMSASVVPFKQATALAVRGPALTLLVGAAVLLVIACFNVANLLLVRSASRTHEFAVQIALGAGRRRLFRLLILESVFLATVGGCLGVSIAWAVLPSLLHMVPTQLPPTADVHISLPVLAAALAATLGAGMSSGLVPALRYGGADVRGALSLGRTRALGDRTGDRILNGLVLFEIATATILLATSTLLIRAFRELTAIDPGFATENLLTMRLSLPSVTYHSDESMTSAAAQIAERIEALAGVVWARAWGPARPGFDLSIQTSVPDEMVIDQISDAPLARRHSVPPGVIEKMGISVVRGRTISATDDADAPFVAVISESMAAELWPGQDPIGKRYHNFQPPGLESPANRHWTVIGVVSDAQHGGRVPTPGVIVTRNDSYFPFAQRPERAFTMLVKTASPMEFGLIRDAIRTFDPTIPIFQVASMTELFAQEEGTSKFAAQLMAVFGMAALLLAALGVYGVLSFTVARRVSEIGLRAALGAEPGSTLMHFLRYGFKLAATGVVLGTITAYAAARGLQTLVPNAPHMDVPAVAIAAGTLVVVAITSCLIPARRATRIAPVVALRGE